MSRSFRAITRSISAIASETLQPVNQPADGEPRFCTCRAEVMRRALAYLSRDVNPKMMYPLVLVGPGLGLRGVHRRRVFPADRGLACLDVHGHRPGHASAPLFGDGPYRTIADVEYATVSWSTGTASDVSTARLA